MKFKLTLILLLSSLIFSFGCNMEEKYTEKIMFKGNSTNWGVFVSYTYQESISPIGKNSKHARYVTTKCEITYNGPKQNNIKNIKYNLSNSNSSSKIGGTSNFSNSQKRPYIITSTSQEGTYTVISNDKAKNIKLGENKIAFPSKADIITLEIIWDNLKEEIILKPENP